VARKAIDLARCGMHFLNGEEIQRIHEVSLRVLENVGITVHSPFVSRMLENSGARLSADGRRILISEDIVKSALATAPKSIVLAGREDDADLTIPSENKMHVANGGEAAFVKNLISGESRYSTTEDVRDFAFLVNKLPQIDFCWMMVGALDQPAPLKNLVQLKTSFEFTSKHVQAMTASAEEARRMIDLGSILAGGRDRLERRHIFSSVQCPVSPLAFEAGLIEAQVEFAKAKVPVVSMVASVAGLTSPATLSGTLTQVNAENLASLVITQTSRKGAPWIYSTDSSAGNLRTGSVDYGAFETQLLRIGAGQMGKFYNLPTMVSGVWLDSVAQSLSSVWEGVPYMILQSIVGSDLGCGFGSTDQAAGASYGQLVIDAWVWEAAREFSRSFETDSEAISFETIREAGLDHNYLNKPHTLSRFRREFISTTNSEATLTSEHEIGTKGSLVAKADEEVRGMLRMPRIAVTERDESDAMSLILKNAK
jgi:trimethylamine--corrinoid protein Co-methyltransferase